MSLVVIGTNYLSTSCLLFLVISPRGTAVPHTNLLGRGRDRFDRFYYTLKIKNWFILLAVFNYDKTYQKQLLPEFFLNKFHN